MDTWTTRKLLAWTTQRFEDKQIDSPRVAAEMLLAHVLGTKRLRLYMEPDRPASAEERDTFRALVARASQHEPVDYLVGHAPFFSLNFAVNPHVLIPRPSTETLIEHVLQSTRTPPPEVPPEAPPEGSQAMATSVSDIESVDEVFSEAGEPMPFGELTYEPENPLSPEAHAEPVEEPPAPSKPQSSPLTPHPLHIADVCTGSGCIAVTLAVNLPHATFVATDLSEDALKVAQQNAQTHGVADRIEFRQGDLLEPLGQERFDFLLSNPPYISDAEWTQVQPNVKDFEPTLALRSGTDGLDHLRPLLAQAHQHLRPNAQALFEFSSTQAQAIQQLAAQAPGLANPQILKDHENFPRILVVDAG